FAFFRTRRPARLIAEQAQPPPSHGETSMKTVLFLFCVMCATAAFGQATSGACALSSEPIPVMVPTHPRHADHQDLLTEPSLLGTSDNISAHGERPLWEFAPKRVEVPLGDAARTLREDHKEAKKSATVVEN